MRRLMIMTCVLSALTVGITGWADESAGSGPSQQPGTSDQTGGVTTAEAKEVSRGMLQDEVVGIKPAVGLVAYTDAVGNATSRGALGFSLDWNLSPLMAEGMKPVYFGIQTGLIYSHLGDPTSNFVGSSASTSYGDGGANLIVIPTDLKLGYNLSDHYRISAHGGANVLYRSIVASGAGGETVNFGGNSNQWTYYPNIGADFEVGFGSSVSMLIRPDWTMTPGNDVFTGTLALGFLIS